MAFQSVPNTVVAEIIVEHGSGRRLQNNLYFEKAGGYDQSDLDDLANSLSGWWATHLSDDVSADDELAEVHVRGLENELDLESYATGDIPTPGTYASAALPANVTIAIKFTTGYVGRSARGRNYFPGLGETHVSANTVNSTLLTHLITAYHTYLPILIPSGWTWVVVSRYHNGAARVVGMTLPVTGVSFTDDRVDTQRRRLG